MSLIEKTLTWAWNKIKSIPLYFETIAKHDLSKIGIQLQKDEASYFQYLARYGVYTLDIMIAMILIAFIGSFAVFMALKPIQEAV